MKYKDFRNFKITRTCKKKYNRFNNYLSFLRKDFNKRCAYCNTDDMLLNENYRVDHFIPQKVIIDANKPSLLTDYNNLMYCCPKCNLSKSSKYSGNINDGSYNNDLFYNPVDIDYNKIFYRNEYGGISSEDQKGKNMIINLKLYSPIYNFAFLIEEIEEVKEKLVSKMEGNIEQKEKYMEIYLKLDTYKKRIENLFKCNYYNNSVRKENNT